MPESYPNHTSNFPILNLGTFARSELVFCEIFSLQPFATGYTTPPAASEKNSTPAPCSVQQHPSLAPLQHELGIVRTLLAAPWNILARQHPQAIPIPASAHQHARSKTVFTAHTALTAIPSIITLRQYLQQHPERHQHRSKLYTPFWQQKRSTYDIITNNWNIFG